MISLERQLRSFYLLLESKQHHITFQYKDEIIKHFFLVDGSHIRNGGHPDFIGGGNAFAYPWMPKDEVWLENLFPRIELAFFTFHEIIESCLMRFKKLSYDSAHYYANHYEGRLRKNPGNYKEIIQNYIEDEYGSNPELEAAIIGLWEQLPK